MKRLPCLLLLLLLTPLQLPADPGKKEEKPRWTNRLSKERSPYLLQHAHNPVDWFPWGAEAFAKAKKEGKLVFLSIGYSSCHWCHVMERESFANESVAKILNDEFVCIKVDREERPDIDTVYMTALHTLGQRGGWPLSMFLTAEGKPIIGGTYWPPEDRMAEGETHLGFKSVLKTVRNWQKEKPEELTKQADTLAVATRKALSTAARENVLVGLDRELVQATVEDLRSEFDAQHGGFGNPQRAFRGTKFPTPPYLSFLLTEAERTRSADVLKMLTVTLDQMAQGGIYDQLGGGFHRYSTERTWTVPHFEKMLYDNAQLVEVYARAYALTRRPLYRKAIVETLAFVERELTAPQGVFYSALDADSEGEEGRCYVWTTGEVEALLPKGNENRAVRKWYGIDGAPNFEEKYHILTTRTPLAEVAKETQTDEVALATRIEAARKSLMQTRSQRPRPFLDTKVLTGWNGEMIAGYATAGKLLDEQKYVATASRAAEFLLKNLRQADGRLARTWTAGKDQAGEARIAGMLDDYAYLIHGLLCLHDATGSTRWLTAARELTDIMIRDFADKEAGGFYLTAHDHEQLFARAKDQYDGAQPSGNSMAARNLVVLAKKTREPRYRTLAEQTIRTFTGTIKNNPSSLTTMAEALALHLEEQQPQEGKGLENVRQLGQGSGGPRKSDSVVKISATAEKPDASGKQVVVLNVEIDKGWHLYANPVENEDLTSVQTTVTFEGKNRPEKVELAYPKGKVVEDKTVGKYHVYDGKVVIKATLKRKAGETGPLEAAVKLQACTNNQCLLPATVKVTIP